MADDVERLREGAVADARSGNFDRGIHTLETLYAAYPDDIKVRSDLVVVYSWKGNYAKSLELFASIPPAAYPSYVLQSAITSYRALGKSEKATPVVDLLLERNPQDGTILLRKALLLVDAGHYAEAEALLSDLLTSYEYSVDVLRVQGYLAAEQEEWITALGKYQDVLVESPGDPEARRGQMNALLHLSAPWGAAGQIPDDEDCPEPRTQIALLQAKAALLLRWSSHASYTISDSIVYAQKAYNLLDDAQHLAAHQPQNQHILRNIAYDRIVAYTNLERHQEAFDLYLSVIDSGDVPPYVCLAAAKSLLGLREPEQARQLLETTFGVEPVGRQETLTLFYSHIEMESYQRAYELIDRLVMETPRFKVFSDSTENYTNDEALDGAIVAALARLYGGQLADAWARTTELQRAAPANSWLSHTVGQVASARQWPRSAFDSYRQAYNLNPHNHSALEGMAQSMIALHHYPVAEAILAELRTDYPLELSTQRLEKDLYWTKRPDLWADFEYSYSDSPEQAGDSILLTGEVISSPINDYLHINGQARYAWSELPEGNESFSRFGAGLEYSRAPFSLVALLNYNDSSIDEVGGVLRGVWNPDDHWTLGIQGEIFSEATPLRALFHGIREDRMSTTFSYRWSESDLFRGGLNYGWFTDDNERLEISLGYFHRLLDIPRFDLDAGLDIYGSTNSETDTPYFNPESDLSVMGLVKAEHILQRYYETSFVQYVEVGLGGYSQENYSSGIIGHVRYDLRYRCHPRVEASLGAEMGQRRYDGENEPYYTIRAQAHAKF